MVGSLSTLNGPIPNHHPSWTLRIGQLNKQLGNASYWGPVNCYHLKNLKDHTHYKSKSTRRNMMSLNDHFTTLYVRSKPYPLGITMAYVAAAKRCSDETLLISACYSHKKYFAVTAVYKFSTFCCTVLNRQYKCDHDMFEKENVTAIRTILQSNKVEDEPVFHSVLSVSDKFGPLAHHMALPMPGRDLRFTNP